MTSRRELGFLEAANGVRQEFSLRADLDIKPTLDIFSRAGAHDRAGNNGRQRPDFEYQRARTNQFFRAPWMDVIMDVPDARFPEADVPKAATGAVAAPAGRVFAAWTC